MFTSFTTVMVASWAMLLNVSDSQIAKPTCCLKQAYCCSIQAKCCSTELAIEKTVPSSKVEPRAEGQPTCCMKRAYCCSIKRSCCPNSDVNKLAEVSVSQTFMTSGETAQPTCCMKRANCCYTHQRCCPKAAETVKDQVVPELETLSEDLIASQATCCMKQAYCCSIKRSCCRAASAKLATY